MEYDNSEGGKKNKKKINLLERLLEKFLPPGGGSVTLQSLSLSARLLAHWKARDLEVILAGCQDSSVGFLLSCSCRPLFLEFSHLSRMIFTHPPLGAGSA